MGGIGVFNGMDGKFGSGPQVITDPFGQNTPAMRAFKAAQTQPGKVGTTQPVTPTLPVIPDIVAGRNRLEDPRFAANPIGHNETFGTSQMDPRFGPMPFSNPFGGFGGFGGLGFGMNPFNQMANSAFNRFGGFQGGNPFIQQFNPRPNPFAIDTQQLGIGGNGKFGSFPPIGLGFENGLNPNDSNAGFGFNFFGQQFQNPFAPQNPVPQPQIPKQQIK